MQGKTKLAAAALAVLVLILILVLVRAAARGREGYLIYPYLDLDEPGERGDYYGLSDGGAARCAPVAAFRAQSRAVAATAATAAAQRRGYARAMGGPAAAAAAAPTEHFCAGLNNIQVYDAPYDYPRFAGREARAWDDKSRCASFCRGDACTVWCR